MDEKLDWNVSNSSCNPPIGAFATDTMLLWTSSAIFSSCNKTVKLLVFSVRDVVEGLNVINGPKCNKVLNVITFCPKCNNNLP